MQSTAKADFAARAIDSLCVLARNIHSKSNIHAHNTAYDYLQRGVGVINAHEKSLLNNTSDSHGFEAFAKLLRCICGAFWNHAITLYQDDNYAAAVRFLVHACELGTKACGITRNLCVKESESGIVPAGDSWSFFKTYLPKRWELLGDCYMRIGDRQASSVSLCLLSFVSCSDSMKRSSPMGR